MGTELLFITTNEWKVGFANRRLNKYGIKVKRHSARLIEPQEIDARDVAVHKAQQILASMKKPFIVEDTGLYVKALSGFPGAFIKPILDTIGDAKFLELMRGQKRRDATIRSILVYGNPKRGELKVFTGECPGRLALYPKGKLYNGWTLSKIFIPYKKNKTLAQLNKAEYLDFISMLEKNDHYEKFGKWITRG
ncbi:MAG: hypothetical protein KGH71_00960 [Candidatus Micrarchaeota archaeon]|nr:hypothetical protein [Candidatus Micrarchaeota archaeon]